MKKTGLMLATFTWLFIAASYGQALEVGDKAPDCSLVDVSGNAIGLSDFKGKKNVVLVFYEEHG